MYAHVPADGIFCANLCTNRPPICVSATLAQTHHCHVSARHSEVRERTIVLGIAYEERPVLVVHIRIVEVNAQPYSLQITL